MLEYAKSNNGFLHWNQNWVEMFYLDFSKLYKRFSKIWIFEIGINISFGRFSSIFTGYFRPSEDEKNENHHQDATSSPELIKMLQAFNIDFIISALIAAQWWVHSFNCRLCCCNCLELLEINVPFTGSKCVFHVTEVNRSLWTAGGA